MKSILEWLAVANDPEQIFDDDTYDELVAAGQLSPRWDECDPREAATRRALATLEGWPADGLDVARDFVVVGASKVPLVGPRKTIAMLLRVWGIGDPKALLADARRRRPFDRAIVIVIVRDDEGQWLSIAYLRFASVRGVA